MGPGLAGGSGGTGDGTRCDGSVGSPTPTEQVAHRRVSRLMLRDHRGDPEGSPVNKHAFHGLRLAATGIAAAGLFVAAAGPVAADTTPTGDASYSQNGRSA